MSGFNLSAGRVLVGKYEVVEYLGGGWEGEVYLVKELATGIERAAKLFYPERNVNNKVAKAYAKKLFRLRHCEALIQYVNQEILTRRREAVTILVSEYVEGEVLTHYLEKQPGQRMPEFEALRLIYDLACGLEPVHRMREYHGDLHGENIIVNRRGLKFEIKLLDFYLRDVPKRESIEGDVLDIVRLLYDLLGGQRHYAKQSPVVKEICCGLKRSLILKKFRHAGRLRQHLDDMDWP